MRPGGTLLASGTLRPGGSGITFFTLCACVALIAFGSCCDAVRLVLGEEFSSEGLEQLDLFNIAEIKKPKDGSLEIKFFDRIKALENLARMEAERTDPGASVTFYRALEESASVFDEGV